MSKAPCGRQKNPPQTRRLGLYSASFLSSLDRSHGRGFGVFLPRFFGPIRMPTSLLTPLSVGPHLLPNRLFVAPMAGVTDRPFRQLCKQLGAGYAVSEMVTSRKDLWKTLKTSRRANHEGETAPIAVQIAGTDAAMMAEAAAYNIDRGAQIIDINMGCPAKKVCNKWAGSALMQDEPLALEIIEAVVAACAPHGVPVTLKMRTGWSAEHKNAVRIARAAEQAGIAMLTVRPSKPRWGCPWWPTATSPPLKKPCRCWP
jgi:hypothetical protein